MFDYQGSASRDADIQARIDQREAAEAKKVAARDKAREKREAARREASDSAVKALRLMGIKPGQTIYCVLAHRASSGMFRKIKLLIATSSKTLIAHDGSDDAQLVDISYLAAEAIGFKCDEQGVHASGCGMDMGFHLVYHLGRAIFREGFAVTGRGRNGDTSGFDKDGGYALKPRWV